MPKTIINGQEGIPAALGKEFAVSDWVTVTQSFLTLSLIAGLAS